METKFCSLEVTIDAIAPATALGEYFSGHKQDNFGANREEGSAKNFEDGGTATGEVQKVENLNEEVDLVPLDVK